MTQNVGKEAKGKEPDNLHCGWLDLSCEILDLVTFTKCHIAKTIANHLFYMLNLPCSTVYPCAVTFAQENQCQILVYHNYYHILQNMYVYVVDGLGI